MLNLMKPSQLKEPRKTATISYRRLNMLKKLAIGDVINDKKQNMNEILKEMLIININIFQDKLLSSDSNKLKISTPILLF